MTALSIVLVCHPFHVVKFCTKYWGTFRLNVTMFIFQLYHVFAKNASYRFLNWVHHVPCTTRVLYQFAVTPISSTGQDNEGTASSNSGHFILYSCFLLVVEFLTKQYCEDDAGQMIFLEAIFQSKIFEQNDILTIFGKCLLLTGSDIKKIAKEAKIASLQDLKPPENHCCKVILHSALNRDEELFENNLLKVVISLMKTKLHFKTFKPASEKDLAVQNLLDDLGKCIENHFLIWMYELYKSMNCFTSCYLSAKSRAKLPPVAILSYKCNLNV